MMDDGARTGPRLTAQELPPASVEVVRNAVIAPMVSPEELACGVFREDGSFCEQSRTLYSANRFTGIPMEPDGPAHLPGRHLFAGIGRHHFGHFLMECIPRLWGLDEAGPVDSLLIVPRHGIDFEAVFKRRLGAFIHELTDGLPVHFVDLPLIVDELVLPSQGMGHRHWITGTERFRRFIRDRLESRIVPDGPDKIYVSRSRLKHAAQMVDQEERIEKLMSKAGYTIFHPQRHSISEQCACYMAADTIVGTDGSAFHLAPFVMRPGTRVGLIQRRWRQAAFDALADQIRAFADVELTTINPLIRPEEGEEVPTDRPPLDYRRLLRKLEAHGFL